MSEQKLIDVIHEKLKITVTEQNKNGIFEEWLFKWNDNPYQTYYKLITNNERFMIIMLDYLNSEIITLGKIEELEQKINNFKEKTDEAYMELLRRSSEYKM